jgi:ATPase subunit of ABC transporter with duplicated ATPase domains
MGATAEERKQKQKINELEQKLKRLQKELQEFKATKKKVGRLRKQAEKAEHVSATYQDLLEEEEKIKIKEEKRDKKKSLYRCRDLDCGSENVDEIYAGSRLIVVCNECGKRFTKKIGVLEDG